MLFRSTDFDDGLACDHGDSGAWLLDEKSAAARTVACLRLCLSCARCRYISVGGSGGRQERDCSGYAACAALIDEAASDRQSVGWGKRVELGGPRIIKKESADHP